MIIGDALGLALALMILGLAVISAIIASRKGRMAIGWFAMGVGIPVFWFMATVGFMSPTISAMITVFLAGVILAASACIASVRVD